MEPSNDKERAAYQKAAPLDPGEDQPNFPISFEQEVCIRSGQLSYECGLAACENGCQTKMIEMVIKRHYDSLRAALQKIKDEEGKVCETFELCTHRACQSSYTSWAIADEALRMEPSE